MTSGLASKLKTGNFGRFHYPDRYHCGVLPLRRRFKDEWEHDPVGSLSNLPPEAF